MRKMEKQQYSGEVNLDHPVIDKRPDGIYMYFHDLPPILLKRDPIIYDQEEDDAETQNLASPTSENDDE